MILAADIGGTKSYIALFDWEKSLTIPIHEEKYFNADFDSVEEILTEFLEDANQPQTDPDIEEGEEDVEVPEPIPLVIESACLGVAGPVLDNRCEATNLPWIIDGPALQTSIDIPHVILRNDIEAMAHGILILPPEDTEYLNRPSRIPLTGTKALLAPGTGLGESILFWDGERYHPHPSEGGHATFAPTSDIEIELLRYLRTSYLHVSFERILSGEGLHHIYQFLRDTKKNEPTWFAEQIPTGDPAALIAEAALKGKPDICVQALDLFISILGGEAGNLALKALSLGGLFLTGGIPPKILPKLRGEAFKRAFVSKGRYKRLLSQIPVSVVLNDKVGLLGAASVAATLAKSSKR
jgi:glucokinase